MANAQFNAVFKEANETRKRYRVLMGGAGSGKSVNTAMDYITKLSDPKYKGCSLLVVRAAEASHLNSTFAELSRAIIRLGLESVWTIKTSSMQMENRFTGNYILFRGCNDLRALERLKSVTVPSGKLCWIWVEEANEIKANDFEILDDRLRGKLPDGFFFQITTTFNPVSASHWLKSRLWDYDDKNTFRHKSTYLDNRFIDDEYRERMERRKTVDPAGYQIYALGNWGEIGGVIFTNIEICDLYEKRFDSFSLGVDFGFNHASVCLLVAHYDGDIYILREVYAKGKTNAEFIDLLDRAKIPRHVLMFCDSAEPDRIKELRQAGYKAYPVKKEPNSVMRQIEWLQQRKIYIDGDCTNMKREIQSYRYKKDNRTGENIDEPLEYDDDCIAALRYSIESQRKLVALKSMNKSVLGIW
ncbi:MAG: PBSX family phage terminase large subunit [Clostridiales bacterium]|jgi:phage terminase large subunit|nr:PBSX family phage terminase large subunit [Clostridiales bacterium]